MVASFTILGVGCLQTEPPVTTRLQDSNTSKSHATSETTTKPTPESKSPRSLLSTPPCGPFRGKSRSLGLLNSFIMAVMTIELYTSLRACQVP